MAGHPAPPEHLEFFEVPNCHGNTGDQGAMARILATIADCRAVLVARIGDGPAAKLAARGITAVADYPWEEVDVAIARWREDAAGRAGGAT